MKGSHNIYVVLNHCPVDSKEKVQTEEEGGTTKEDEEAQTMPTEALPQGEDSQSEIPEDSLVSSATPGVV